MAWDGMVCSRRHPALGRIGYVGVREGDKGVTFAGNTDKAVLSETP